MYIRIVSTDKICSASIADRTERVVNNSLLQNWKQTLFEPSTCEQEWDTRTTPAHTLQTRLRGYVSGAPVSHGNAEVSTVRPTVQQIEEACTSYSETNSTAAGRACIFGTLESQYSLVGNDTETDTCTNFMLQSRTRPVLRLTCTEVLSVLDSVGYVQIHDSEDHPSQTDESCPLVARDVAYASFHLGYVPIIITDAAHLGTQSAQRWSGLDTWASGHDVFSFFNQKLDMGEGCSTLEEYMEQKGIADLARQRANDLNLDGVAINHPQLPLPSIFEVISTRSQQNHVFVAFGTTSTYVCMLLISLLLCWFANCKC